MVTSAPARAPSQPIDIFVCGGSQLAATGLAPTAALTARLARGVRALWGVGTGSVFPVYCDTDPASLARELGRRIGERPFAVVVIPRNVPAVLDGPADALRRLVAPDLSLPAELPRGRSVGSCLLGHVWYAAWLGSAPIRLVRYRRRLDASVAFCRASGMVRLVLATPVPYPRARSRRARLYQRLLAALIRSWAGDEPVADLFGRLTAGGVEPLLPDDPYHLTPEGHRRAAAEVLRALGRLRPD